MHSSDEDSNFSLASENDEGEVNSDLVSSDAYVEDQSINSTNSINNNLSNESLNSIRQQQPNQQNGSRTLEQTYQKKTPREHVLLRPDTYIGSIQSETQKLQVYDQASQKMVLRDISYVPGLHKIFDEILVNAADNKQRDKNMKNLNIEVDTQLGQIKVYNDGKGIPIKIHKQHKIYIPELIFGHMLTSSNFDDSVKRVVGGRNGYGAKLTNIYSKEFIVTTSDGKQQFVQKHTNNMIRIHEPRIFPAKSKTPFTQITFKPDFEKFGMQGFDEDCIALLTKRIYDLAGVTDRSVTVRFNNQPINVNCFKDFLSLYVMEDMPIMYLKAGPRQEIGVSCATEGHFQQVSYVNGIATTQGGRHVDHVADIITKSLAKSASRKDKEIRPRQIKDFLFLFVNCLIENPAFKSQTKDELTTKIKDFGSKCEIPDSFLKKLQKSQIVKEAIAMANHKESRKLARKTDGRKTTRVTGIDKLEDANNAGTKKSMLCTLILTEGDSAASLASKGLAVVGRDNYGIFPLRGKLLNVRDATISQVSNNPEIKNLKKILGLRDGVSYSDDRELNTLRYGHVMIMTDQDFDGSHIKGLVINMFHRYQPALLKRRDFLNEFITPIVVCRKKRRSRNGGDGEGDYDEDDDGRKEVFYTIPEFDAQRQSNDAQKWDIKYYKGLGTSTDREAKSYFAALTRHRIYFRYIDHLDDEAIELAFSKAKIENRKQQLQNFREGLYLDQNVSYISYQDFVHKELILFSRADNIRSIPSMVDGFKPGQRKIMYAAFKRKLNKDVKVAQFSGYVGENAAYHHGEVSLTETIVKLAQNFVGSNNINLMVPSGQFGTRAQGGKDSASARYIFTRLSRITRTIFVKEDDAILNYLEDDGTSIEPDFYLPIIPMVLVNGAEGIGTGQSTFIPNYNPRDLVRNIKLLLNNNPQQKLTPQYRGWNGVLREIGSSGSYAMVGRIEILDQHTARITELPLKMQTMPYKVHLESLIEQEILSDIRAHHTAENVSFTVTTSDKHPIEEVSEYLLKVFKLTGKLSTNNMILFDSNGKICRYNSPEDILQDFFELRLNAYKTRKEALIKSLEDDLSICDNRVRFITAVISGALRINNRPKFQIIEYLIENNFDKHKKQKKKVWEQARAQDQDDDEQEQGQIQNEDEDSSGYDYLLSMAIWSLTLERVNRLKEEFRKKKEHLESVKALSIKSMQLGDLEAFENALAIKEHDDSKARRLESKFDKSIKRGGANIPKTKKRKHKSKNEENGSEENAKKKIKIARAGAFHPSEKQAKTLGNIFSKLLAGEEQTETDINSVAGRSNNNGAKKRKMENKASTLSNFNSINKSVANINNEIPKDKSLTEELQEMSRTQIIQNLAEEFGEYKTKIAIKNLEKTLEGNKTNISIDSVRKFLKNETETSDFISKPKSTETNSLNSKKNLLSKTQSPRFMKLDSYFNDSNTLNKSENSKNDDKLKAKQIFDSLNDVGVYEDVGSDLKFKTSKNKNQTCDVCTFDNSSTSEACLACDNPKKKTNDTSKKETKKNNSDSNISTKAKRVKKMVIKSDSESEYENDSLKTKNLSLESSQTLKTKKANDNTQSKLNNKPKSSVNTQNSGQQANRRRRATVSQVKNYKIDSESSLNSDSESDDFSNQSFDNESYVDSQHSNNEDSYSGEDSESSSSDD